MQSKMERVRFKTDDLPVYKDSAAPGKPVLDEFNGFGKVFEEIFIFDIVHFDNSMLKPFKELFFQWQAEHGKYVCDTGILEHLSSTDREKSGLSLNQTRVLLIMIALPNIETSIEGGGGR